jgi:hypothetical protein
MSYITSHTAEGGELSTGDINTLLVFALNEFAHAPYVA